MNDSNVAITSLTAFAHVADIERSIDFYKHLGLECVSDWDHEGKRVWAQLQNQQARLMIAIASAPILPVEQAVLFYCYADDVEGLRRQLVDNGIDVSEVNRPDYMPHGELRVTDPDGYVLLIGQLEPLNG